MHQFVLWAGRAGRHDGEGKVRASSESGYIEGQREKRATFKPRGVAGRSPHVGEIAVDAIGAGDWLVGSWSADGVPRWIPRMHYYRREDRKLYLVRPNIIPPNKELTVDPEDKDLDPQRAKFIIENIETWERELQPVGS